MNQLSDEVIHQILEWIIHPSPENSQYSYNLLALPLSYDVRVTVSSDQFGIREYVEAQCGFYPCQIHVSEPPRPNHSDERFGSEDEDVTPNKYHPLYSVSMVNQRIRRIVLPLFLESVDIILYRDGKVKAIDREAKLLRRRFCTGRAHLTDLIRNVRIISVHSIEGKLVKTSARRYLPVVTEILQRCPNIKKLYLSYPRHREEFSQYFPLFHRVNSLNQDPDFQLVFPYPIGDAGFGSDDFKIPPLFRIAVWCLDGDSDDYLYKFTLSFGLNVVEINGIVPGWETRTFFGLSSVQCSRSEQQAVTPNETVSQIKSFLSRHPLLRRVSLKEYQLNETPWGVQLLEDMKPHRCVLPIGKEFVAAPFDTTCDLLTDSSGSSQDWHIVISTLHLQVKPGYGVVDAIKELVKALPEIRALHFDFDHDSSREIESLDMKDLLPIFAQGFKNLTHLAFPVSVFRSIVRDYLKQTGQPVDRVTITSDMDDLTHLCGIIRQNFFNDLVRSVPTLKVIRFCTSEYELCRKEWFVEFEKAKENGEIVMVQKESDVSDWFGLED